MKTILKRLMVWIMIMAKQAWRAANKYRNVKVEVDGHIFDSKAEAARYAVLKIQEQAGIITKLKLQKKFQLIPNQKDPKTGKTLFKEVSYVADFVYYDSHGEFVIEDVKGFRTPIYRLKRALFYFRYGWLIKEIDAKECK